MSSKTKTIERNGGSKNVSIKSVWTRAFTADSEWPDKVSLLINMFLIVFSQSGFRKNFLM